MSKKVLLQILVLVVFVLVTSASAFAAPAEKPLLHAATYTKTCTKNFYSGGVKVAYLKMKAQFTWNSSHVVKVDYGQATFWAASGWSWSDKRSTFLYDWGSYVVAHTQGDLNYGWTKMYDNTWVQAEAHNGSNHNMYCGYGGG